MEKRTALPRPPPAEQDGLLLRDLGRLPGGSHQDDRLVRLERRAEARASAHLEDDRPEKALLGVHPRPREREPFHREAHLRRGQVQLRRRCPRCREVDDRREGLVVLQAVELARLEFARRHGRVNDDLDDVLREAVHLVDARDELVIEPLEERPQLRVARGLRRRIERLRGTARTTCG